MKNQIELEIIQDLSLILWKERRVLHEKRLTLQEDMNATVREWVRINAKIEELKTANLLIQGYFDKFKFSDDKMFAKIAKEREKLEGLDYVR